VPLVSWKTPFRGHLTVIDKGVQNLTVGTIKSHVGAILGKLEWSSRTQAVIVAARRGLVQRGLDSFELA
jgi:hypothetical protein